MVVQPNLLSANKDKFDFSGENIPEHTDKINVYAVYAKSYKPGVNVAPDRLILLQGQTLADLP
jgi:hypothetical protein